VKNWILSRGLFWGATFAALLLYFLSAPDGLPWSGSTQWAAAYADGLTGLPHPVWGHFVQMFAGHHVVLAWVAVSLAAGFLAALAFRFFGWRVGVGAALAWMFAPAVWNRAVTGDWQACLAAVGVFGGWLGVQVGHRVFRKVRVARRSSRATGDVEAAPPGQSGRWSKWNRRVSWGVMGAGIVFALASLTAHDYRLGEAASVYARGVVEAAGERIVVLNGVCDEQVVREVENRGGRRKLSTVSLRNDDVHRARLVAAVRYAFPDETNLWTAARIGAAAFAEAAVKAHPDRFYGMDGRNTTLEAWERRWEAFKPYLECSDPFVPMGRRLFGYEGNAVANAQGDEKVAWQLYKRIHTEIDPGNFSALVNMSEMIRRGYAVSVEEKKRLQESLEKFFKSPHRREYAREIARNAGPIRVDPAMLARLEAEAKRRVAEKIAAGETVEAAPEMLSLVEWNNEMVRAMENGDLAAAGRIARAILSNPKWTGFIPANSVMGTVSLSEGDYVASETFFRQVISATNDVPRPVLNDFADTLLHLGKLEEAESVARRAIGGADEKLWLARLTLAEVLVEKRKAAKGYGGRGEEGETEVRALLKSVMANCPTGMRERVRAKVGKLRREVRQ